MYWTGKSLNNLLSYCGLVVARISASEKDLPVKSNMKKRTFEMPLQFDIVVESDRCLKYILQIHFTHNVVISVFTKHETSMHNSPIK